MKLIKKMVEQIDKEIEASEDYASCALKHKEDNKELTDLYIKLSSAELDHTEWLHAHITRIIEKHKMEKGEVPVEMKAIWEYEHEKHIHKIAEIRIMLDMARR